MKTMLVAMSLVVGGNVSAKELKADTEKTQITWLGKKVTGQHNGTIKLKSGTMTVEENAIVSGKFVIDMTSLENVDIADSESNQKLVGHLKSDDFFGVDKYPEATLAITEKAEFTGDQAHVKGDLTIKGTTHPVEFHVTRDGQVYTTKVTVNRAKYNVRYGSKSFFNDLGDKVIYDDFEIGVKLVTED
ncbi:MAG: YceI family protein [Prolixibacteraceae bacterium]